MANKQINKGPGMYGKVILRLLKMLFSFYPVALPLTALCIIFSAIVNSVPTVFMQKIIAIIETSWQKGDWQSVSGEIFGLMGVLLIFYVLSLVSIFTFNQMMAIITQGSLKKLRINLFSKMQHLPIRYFDTHNHGDVMSYYTNDADSLRQLISQSIPQLLMSSVTVVTLLFVMLRFSLWMTLVLITGVVCMFFITKKVGGSSARYFFKQQESIGKLEGYVEEMMQGQKVIKVFCHEEASKKDFDALNDGLFDTASKANKYANILGPILNNTGNVVYGIVAVVGGILLMYRVPNLSLSGMALSISVVIPFLNITKQFTGSINQVSQQINSVIMALAGAQRIFTLLDETPEIDDGYVSLVNIREENGRIQESDKATGLWAWKHPHQNGEITYTRLTGDVRLAHVDFSYDGKKKILQDINLYAEPGQKLAFVGATGAGKTTITNLLNRFYDIDGGKIRYDGINIEKIKKDSLRLSLGIVLQDTELFTGTVMDNIRYGKLTATDAECIEAAKRSGADDFISRLPEGYDTPLTGNGSNLSQGQRQLLAISRAAVADPPVMILDEATSSIDTRTEAIVQRGMDALMHGRTVFVIAHRLSTVKNADVIMVLDHGVITERGSHKDLIAQKGKYYQLYTGAFELE